MHHTEKVNVKVKKVKDEDEVKYDVFDASRMKITTPLHIHWEMLWGKHLHPMAAFSGALHLKEATKTLPIRQCTSITIQP